MALVANTLATGLESMTPVDNEAAAVSALADAWHTYFLNATVNGVSALPAPLAAAKTAMTGALSGLSVIDAGATVIQSAITAYWGVVTPAAATIWITVPPLASATPPPTLSGIAAALAPVFTSNTSGGLSLSAAAGTVAAVLHTNGGLGGIATDTGATPYPIL